MGGSGASLGTAKQPYGTEYTTVYEQGNIKYLTRNQGDASAPLETQTKGRVYVTINSADEPAFISYYDKANLRYKTIDLRHYHVVDGKPLKPHTAFGYHHNGLVRAPTTKEQKMVERVLKTWQNRK
jgi:hypothetical protein